MNTEAIVLRRAPAGEHDQVVVLYGASAGKLAVVARGSLRTGSRQGPALDEGNLIRCELVAGRGELPIVTAAQAQRCWAAAKADPVAWAAAAALLQAVDALTWAGQPDERTWGILRDGLASLDAGAPALDTFRRCQASLVEALGYGAREVPVAGPVRTALDDELEQVAQRRLGGTDLLYRLMAKSGIPW